MREMWFVQKTPNSSGWVATQQKGMSPRNYVCTRWNLLIAHRYIDSYYTGRWLIEMNLVNVTKWWLSIICYILIRWDDDDDDQMMMTIAMMTTTMNENLWIVKCHSILLYELHRHSSQKGFVGQNIIDSVIFVLYSFQGIHGIQRVGSVDHRLLTQCWLYDCCEVQNKIL